jgi:hypothetical protein
MIRDENMARDIVEALAPIEDEDALLDEDSKAAVEMFKVGIEAAKRWRASHRPDERADISVKRDENGHFVAVVTPCERGIIP